MKIVALNKKEWVEEQFKSGLNCAQIVSLYFAEKYGYNKSDMIKVACGFGGGMRKGEVCGAHVATARKWKVAERLPQ